MRVLLALSDPTGTIQTALLQERHDVLHHVPTRPLAVWRAYRAAAAFRPEMVLTDTETGEDLARRLAIRACRPSFATEFLLDAFPPIPFGPTRRDPPELAQPQAGPPPPALIPDIVQLNATTLSQAPHWMAAARPIVAPDTEAARALFTHEETALLHPPDDPAPPQARLLAEAELCHHLAVAARAEFVRRHNEARARLRGVMQVKSSG
jgi:hypothetical protein